MPTVVFKSNYLLKYAHKRHQIICKTYQPIAFRVFPEQGSGFSKLLYKEADACRTCAQKLRDFGPAGDGTK